MVFLKTEWSRMLQVELTKWRDVVLVVGSAQYEGESISGRGGVEGGPCACETAQRKHRKKKCKTTTDSQRTRTHTRTRPTDRERTGVLERGSRAEERRRTAMSKREEWTPMKSTCTTEHGNASSNAGVPASILSKASRAWSNVCYEVLGCPVPYSPATRVRMYVHKSQ